MSARCGRMSFLYWDLYILGIKYKTCYKIPLNLAECKYVLKFVKVLSTGFVKVSVLSKCSFHSGGIFVVCG
jgi:hypothetical protein